MVRRKRAAAEQPDPLVELAELAELLNLTSLTGEVIAKSLEQAESDSLSFSDFALALLRSEHRVRHERRLNRNLKRSRLGSLRDRLDDFDFGCRPKLNARTIRELLNCRWIEEGRNIICVGRPGLGKTRVIKALGHSACEHGYTVLYVNTAELLEQLQVSAADGTYRRTIQRLQRIDVLALDEFAYSPIDTKATNHLFRLVSARHGLAPTLLAANTGFSKWSTLFPSEAQAVATVDRLIDNATILHFTGKSFRKPKDGPLDIPEE